MRDEDLAGALRAELDQRTSPPVRGGLTEVVSRGRRRRRTQQIGAALAAVAAIVGTAFVASAVGQPNALPPAVTNTPTTTLPPSAMEWPKADLPPQTPYGTFTPAATSPPIPGRPVEPVPICAAPDTAGRDLNSGSASPDLQRRVVDGLRAVSGATVGELETRHFTPTKPGTRDAYQYRADITDADGTGSVVLLVGSFTGAPLAAADQQAFDQFNCDPPKRHVLADGTVLQIYARQMLEPFQSQAQVLRIYRPSGELYTLAVQSFGSPDFQPNPAQPDMPIRVGAGRATLPLTEGQLSELGLAIVKG